MSADVTSHGRGGVDQTPVDSGLPGSSEHAHQTRTIKTDLGVAAPPLIGHRNEPHHGGATVNYGGRTRSRVPASNRQRDRAHSNRRLAASVVDKV